MKASYLPRYLLLIAASTMALSASAADPKTSVPSAPQPQEVQAHASIAPSGGEAPERALSPPMVEIKAALEVARRELAALEQRAADQTDVREFLEIQRRIEQLQIDTELQILGIQAEHLRRAGREDAARRIEESIARATSPRPAPTPVERAAPDGSAER